MNMYNYNKMRRPPADTLKTIQGGRLRGMTDIKPQWRYEILTEVYGPCGTGWKFAIEKLWNEPGSEGQIFAFASILLYVKENGEWSDGIPGVGGSMLVEKEKNGLHSTDEGYKAAITDALSTASKMLGVAADIYAGKWDGSKYKESPKEKEVEKMVKSVDLLAGYTDEIDKLNSADEIQTYTNNVYVQAKKELSQGDYDKFIKYSNDAVNAWGAGK
jgi:hypothetical protein